MRGEVFREAAGMLIENEKPDLVHIGHPMRLGAFIGAARDYKIPYIITLTDFWLLCPKGIMLDNEDQLCGGPEGGNACHDLCPQFSDQLIRKRIGESRQLLYGATNVISPSRFLAGMFMKEIKDLHVGVINHGLDRGSLKNNNRRYRKGDKLNFIYAGSLTRHKGVHVLIEAFTKLKANNITLKIFGSGPDGHVDLLKKKAGKDRRIQFCGVFSEEQVGDIFSGADAVVVPSLWFENYPLVLHEALACNAPVIASNVGGMAEKIQDGFNGFTFRMGDVSDLRRILNHLINNPELFNTLKGNLKNFFMPTIEQEAFAYQKLYTKAADSHRREDGEARVKKHNEKHAERKAAVSIIIPVFNKVEYTSRCLETLYLSIDGEKEFEVIIVDNGSTDSTGEFLERAIRRHPNLRVISNQKNLGFAKACNRGARAASSGYLLFLNNDTELQNGWLETLMKILDYDESVAAAGSKLLFPDGTIQHAGVIIAEDRKSNDPLLAEHIYLRKPSDLPAANRLITYQALTAACLLVRKSAFEEVDGFDEGYLNGYEDVDLCFKLHQKGWKLVYQPASVVIHHESKSGPERFAKVSANRERLHTKWLGTIKPDVILEKDGSITQTDAGQVRYYSALKACCEKSQREINRDNDIISIVILTFNQLEYTKKCVESIRKYTPEHHEIIFVDNGSKDGTVKWLKQLVKEDDNYRLIENSKNLGFSKGCNQGIEASGGQYILLLNNDVVVTEGWLSGMIECLESSPETGIIGPMTNNISGIQKDIFADYQSVDHLDVYAKGFRERNRHRRIPVRRVVGFCMLFRRELVGKIGMLDESFGSGNFEDDDFCLRAALEGYENYIAGGVFIHHYGNRTFLGNRIDYYAAMAKNRKLFAKKWNGIDTASPLGKKLLVLKAAEKAESLYQKGMIQEAVEEYLNGIKHAPEDSGTYYALSEMLIDEKRFSDAGDVLKEIPSSEKSVKLTALFGYCNEGMDLTDEAEQCTDAVLSLDRKNALALNLKGVLAYKKGQIDEAEKLFSEAVACDPAFGEPHTNLGVLKWSAGIADEALYFSEKGFVLSPSQQDMLTIYHSIASAQGEFERMEWRLREAKSLHPFHRRITFFLIDVLIQQGKNEDAMREIQEAMITFGTDEGIISAALEIRKRIEEKKNEEPDAVHRRQEKGKLSLCMIVKNEEKYLARCLKNAPPVVDEIVVIDTGSTDRTKDIAEIFGAKVHNFTWKGDFSEARNFSLNFATGDWILVLDADEVISSDDHEAIGKLVRRNDVKPFAYSFVTRNYVKEMTVTGWTENKGRYREEAGTGWFPGEKVRLFPNDQRIRFENPVHELVEPSLKQAGIRIKDCSVPIHHYGKLGSDNVISKGDDYYLIGKKKLEEKKDDIQALFELAVQTTELKKYDKAVELWKSVIAFPGKVPDEILARAYLNMGGAYLELGKYGEAITSSGKAVELAPEFKGAVMNYALAELCAGDISRTFQALEDLLVSDDYPPAKTLLAAAYCISGKNEKGREYLHEMKGTGFNAAGYLYHYAKNIVSAGKRQEGTVLLESAVESGNVNKDILVLLAECYRNTDIGQAVHQPV